MGGFWFFVAIVECHHRDTRLNKVVIHTLIHELKNGRIGGEFGANQFGDDFAAKVLVDEAWGRTRSRARLERENAIEPMVQNARFFKRWTGFSIGKNCMKNGRKRAHRPTRGEFRACRQTCRRTNAGGDRSVSWPHRTHRQRRPESAVWLKDMEERIANGERKRRERCAAPE
jgi:hypothetical protein